MVKNETVMELTNEEFGGVINNSQVVVVDFFAEWCMPCVMLGPVIDDLAEEIKEVKFVKVNVDDNQELSGKYNISSIPCLIIFKNGEEVDRIIGGQPADVIEEKIRKWL